MVVVVAFGCPVADITAFWSTVAEEHCVAIAQGEGNDTFAGVGVLIAVEVGHDLLF